jgi:S-formylglutathione hydrolase FrmB
VVLTCSELQSARVIIQEKESPHDRKTIFEGSSQCSAPHLFASSVFSQQAVSAPSTSSKLLELKIPAPSLKGNLLGDTTEQPIYVYLPPGYQSSTTKRFPTLYLLHGFLSTSKVWVNGSYQGFNIQSSMDELIKAGRVREMIVVAANGFNAYGGSFYTNSPVTGNWEDFIVRDLVDNIDANYRTIARAVEVGSLYGWLRGDDVGDETS